MEGTGGYDPLRNSQSPHCEILSPYTYTKGTDLGTLAQGATNPNGYLDKDSEQEEPNVVGAVGGVESAEGAMWELIEAGIILEDVMHEENDTGVLKKPTKERPKLKTNTAAGVVFAHAAKVDSVPPKAATLHEAWVRNVAKHCDHVKFVPALTITEKAQLNRAGKVIGPRAPEVLAAVVESWGDYAQFVWGGMVN